MSTVLDTITSVTGQLSSIDPDKRADKNDIQNPVQFKLTYSLIQKDPVQPNPGDPLSDVNICSNSKSKGSFKNL
ncbi:UNVERIFIED_CONTAM: hypothetical protein NCL1_22831 [Trichonephila clavipes]